MKTTRWVVLATTALTALPVPTMAQEASAAPPPTPETEQIPFDSANTIVVVGTQIRGSQVTAALPVTVLDTKAIEATAAVSGDELLRTVPQIGDTDFNPTRGPQSSNFARGDVASVDLRNLGIGNTLVLINGRRMVQHPVSQAGIANVPVLTYNANSLPVGAIQRVEVLRDGAAAIYGADAVAGVLNVVLKDDYQGVRLNTRYGSVEGSGAHDFNTNGVAGFNFGEGRGNLTFMGEYTHRSAQKSEDFPYTATNDLRPLFANDPAYSGSDGPDGRSSYTPWANFNVVGNVGVRQNGTRITSAAGSFHIQPNAVDGCTAALSSGVCLASGNLSYGRNRELRFDNAVNTTVTPRVDRVNLYATTRYDVTDSITAFAEGGYYHAKSQQLQPPVIRLNDVTVPASNYWNPFGAVTLPDGSVNPNRLPGLTNVPAEGLPVVLTRYRFVDTGPQVVDVTNEQWRIVGGLRGMLGGFDWETSFTYSVATATDLSDNIDATALQRQLSLSTPDAYNPFSGGGCDGNFSVGDCTPSSQAAIDPIVFKLRRDNRTTLTLAEGKLSRPDLFALPGGNVGMAFGVAFRHESQEDNRDPNLDGTITFTDSVTGRVDESNVIAVSPTPDTFGARDVFSAYAEFAVPVISPDMNIPLVDRMELQLAGRYENYSDFGSIFRPKVAGFWDIVDGVRIRGSYSKGFRAPNLEQINAAEYGRLATNNDYIRCEADLRAGRIATFNDCSQPVGYSIRVAGNPDLEPERSDDTSVGIVLQPNFIPPEYGRLTITADYWEIKQKGIVGQFGGSNSLVLDYLNQLGGTNNPNVERAAPNADDIAFFAGTGIDPVGQVQRVNDEFVNLLPQTVRGLDMSLNYVLDDTSVGSFNFSVNAAHFLEFSRDTGDSVQQLFEARDAGIIDAATPLSNAEDLLGRGGRPPWKLTSTLTWDYGPFEVGALGQYTGVIYDDGFLSDEGEPYRVGDQFTANLYVQYTFDELGPLRDARLRLGARNMFDKQPLISEGGYYGALYQPYGRYLYASIGVGI